jgi:LPXTG-site transpeptidase (sortase) family protein
MKKYLSVVFALVFMVTVGMKVNVNSAFAALPVCSDFIDNDSDGLVDIADPQCHTDLDASNAGTWDEFGTSEKSLVPPVVDAGPDVTITSTLGTVASAATASDTDGVIVTYEWTFVSGPAGSSFTSPATLATDFANMVPGVYVFKLKVTDNDGLTAEDTVQITVNTPSSGGGGGSSGGGGGGRIILPTTPVITPVPPVGQVLGATATACGVETGRPCVLQKTGGKKISERTRINRNATALAVKEQNKLVISKLGIDKPILSLPSIASLFKEAMILPWTSTPDKGGNTVLVGHAYYLRNGLYSKSTFYELDTMKAGDEIEMYWKGVKYTYVVSEMKKVKSSYIEIEDQTTVPTLTIYSCGRFTNLMRTVVIATLKK